LPALRLEAGMPADLVLFDHAPAVPFALQATVIAGRRASRE
jgi:hypothetical protein